MSERVDFYDEPGVHVDNENVDLGVLDNSEDMSDDVKLSRDIAEVVTRSVVSNVNMDRVSELEEGTAYLIDFSGSKSAVLPSWLQALKNLIVAEQRGATSDALERLNASRKKSGLPDLRADAALYIKAKSGTITLAGFVDTLQCYKLLRNMIKASLGSEIKIYTKKGSKAIFEEWGNTDISGVRLKL